MLSIKKSIILQISSAFNMLHPQLFVLGVHFFSHHFNITTFNTPIFLSEYVVYKINISGLCEIEVWSVDTIVAGFNVVISHQSIMYCDISPIHHVCLLTSLVRRHDSCFVVHLLEPAIKIM